DRSRTTIRAEIDLYAQDHDPAVGSEELSRPGQYQRWKLSPSQAYERRPRPLSSTHRLVCWLASTTPSERRVTFHFWKSSPLQGRARRPASPSSRQRPVFTFRRVRSTVTCHCWKFSPVQGCARSPAPLSSRHLLVARLRKMLMAVSLVPLPGSTSCAVAVVDRKSTRLNSSHVQSSHAVFCLE